MKVWMCKRDNGYSGGLAVVAANSKEEAFRVFHETPGYSYHYMKNVDDGYFYKKDNWFECKQLTANVDKPCVIEEDGYTE